MPTMGSQYSQVAVGTLCSLISPKVLP